MVFLGFRRRLDSRCGRESTGRFQCREVRRARLADLSGPAARLSGGLDGAKPVEDGLQCGQVTRPKSPIAAREALCSLHAKIPS